MVPKHACRGKVASAATKKNEQFIKKLQSPIMGALQKQPLSDDDKDQHDPGKATTSGLVPEGSKNLCGVSVGPNTPRTPRHTTLTHVGEDLSSPDEVNDLCANHVSAEESAQKADWIQSQETPGPHYPLEPPLASPSQAPKADKGKQREETPHRRSEKLLDFLQVPSEWRMENDKELFIRLKAQESIKNRPESRHSQDAEGQKEFPPPIQPHAVPNKARLQ